MQNSSLVAAIEKLAIAGEQAGFSVEQMIQLLNDGMTVERLLDLITLRHQMPNPYRVPNLAELPLNSRYSEGRNG